MTLTVMEGTDLELDGFCLGEEMVFLIVHVNKFLQNAQFCLWFVCFLFVVVSAQPMMGIKQSFQWKMAFLSNSFRICGT